MMLLLYRILECHLTMVGYEKLHGRCTMPYVDAMLFGGGVCLSQVDWGKENKWSHHPVLWPKNYVYSVLMWKD